MRYLTKKEMQRLPPYDMALTADFERRLRNALIALADLDPAWILWVEHFIDPKCMTIYEMAREVEWRTHTLLLKRHGWFGHLEVGYLIYREWPFQDNGNLSPG